VQFYLDIFLQYYYESLTAVEIRCADHATEFSFFITMRVKKIVLLLRHFSIISLEPYYQAACVYPASSHLNFRYKYWRLVHLGAV
jgi:hypothetical protein